MNKRLYWSLIWFIKFSYQCNYQQKLITKYLPTFFANKGIFSKLVST